jgi:putative methanogenesis marker protein 3
MLIKVNNEEIDLREWSTIKDAIKKTNAPYTHGSIISLIKGTKEFESTINKYKLKTPKGNIIIEMLLDADSLIKIWRYNYQKFKNKGIRWTTSNEIAIGPVVTDLEASTHEFSYKQGDVILSLSGFSNETTHLIIFKEDSTGVYGVPLINQGIFAKVIGGKRTLNNLTNKDYIIEVEKVIERESFTDSTSVSDLDTVLEENNQIFTYVLLQPNQNSPQSVEHLFSLINEDKIKVDYQSNSFLGFYKMQGLGKEKEFSKLRDRGTVTLRNTGKGIGKVYIYREDRVQSPAHTVIGSIKKGMELIDTAKFGDYITIKSDPERIMTMNMTQKEANELLITKKIEQIRQGVTDDDALVVIQEPVPTLDILKEKKVKTTGIIKDNLILVDIYSENSPRSSWYFKKITKLVEKPIGTLKVHVAASEMKLFLFKGDDKEAKGLIPENSPKDNVPAGTIAITNMSRKNIGLVGVRFEDNAEYGPTGEPFDGTNIVGKIITDFEVLKKLKDGEIVYIKES